MSTSLRIMIGNSTLNDQKVARELLPTFFNPKQFAKLDILKNFFDFFLKTFFLQSVQLPGRNVGKEK